MPKGTPVTGHPEKATDDAYKAALWDAYCESLQKGMFRVEQAANCHSKQLEWLVITEKNAAYPGNFTVIASCGYGSSSEAYARFIASAMNGAWRISKPHKRHRRHAPNARQVQ